MEKVNGITVLVLCIAFLSGCSENVSQKESIIESKSIQKIQVEMENNEVTTPIEQNVDYSEEFQGINGCVVF